MFVSPTQAATMIEDFMLGAVMQQDPFLEQFGEFPDEPPDDDPCWDAMPIGDDGDDKAETTMVSTENPATIQPPQHMEQGLLFGEEAMPTIPNKPSPQTRKDTTAPGHKADNSKPVNPRPSAVPPPYTPRHYPYKEILKWFNGDTALATHYFTNQKVDAD